MGQLTFEVQQGSIPDLTNTLCQRFRNTEIDNLITVLKTAKQLRKKHTANSIQKKTYFTQLLCIVTPVFIIENCNKFAYFILFDHIFKYKL